MVKLCHALGDDPVEAQRRVDAGEIKLGERKESKGQDKKAAQS